MACFRLMHLTLHYIAKNNYTPGSDFSQPRNSLALFSSSSWQIVVVTLGFLYEFIKCQLVSFRDAGRCVL